MPATTSCTPCCTEPQTINVPGAEGDAGIAGTNGLNAYTTTTANILLPAAPPSPVVAVSAFVSTAWMAVGQVIFISDETNWGHFEVLTIPSSTGATLQWLNYENDSGTGLTIGSGSRAVPSGTQPPLSAALPAAVVYSALTTAGAVDNLAVAAGVGVHQLFFPHTFIGGTAAVESVTTWTPGYKFKIISWEFVTNALLVGAAGSRVANMEINAIDVGTVPSTVTIPIANAVVGTVTAGTAVSGAQSGSASDTFSIEIANGGTAFTAGSGTFVVKIQNMDTADAVASLALHINDLILALT